MADDPVLAQYLKEQGGGTATQQGGDPLLAQYEADQNAAHNQRVTQRRQTVSAPSDFARAGATALADVGANFAHGMLWLADKATGGKLPSIHDTEQDLEDYQRYVHNFYGADMETPAAKTGYVTGAVVGHGATLAAEGAGVAGLAEQIAPKLATAARLSSAIKAGREGTFAQRLAAQVIPAAPVDFVMGAGGYTPPDHASTGVVDRVLNPQSRLEAGAQSVAIGAVLPTAIEGGRSLVRAGKSALHAAADVGDGMMEAGARGVAEAEPGHLTTGMPPEHLMELADAGERARDPLSARNVAARRLAVREAADVADRTAMLGKTTATEPAAVKPAAGYHIDANGQVQVTPTPFEQTVAPPVREPLVEAPPVFEPMPEAPPVTTQTRKLDASQGGRRVEDGPAQSFEGTPSPNPLPIFSPEAQNVTDATRRIEIATSYRNRTHAPITDESRLIPERTGAQPTEGPGPVGPAIPMPAASENIGASNVTPRPDLTPTGETPHRFSSTQIDLPPETATAIQRLGASIPDEHLAASGREARPHITVKYGLHDSDPAAVQRALEGEAPVTVTLGKTSIFPNGESNNGDVVKVDVDSPALHRLNQKIADAAPHTDTHPDYKPHATIAYVKPGLGEQYAGSDALAGHSVTVDRVTFSAKDGSAVEIPLTGGAAPVAKVNTSKELLEHARTPGGNIRDLRRVSPDALLEELRGVQDKMVEAAGRTAYRNVESEGGSDFVRINVANRGADGVSMQGKAHKTLERLNGYYDRITGELENRGWGKDDIYDRLQSINDEHAAANEAIKAATDGPHVNEKGELVDENGISLFGMNPATPLLAGAAGGTQGDTNEDRFRNAVALATLATVGGVAARKAYNAFTGKVSLTPLTADAERALGRTTIDFDGSSRRQLQKQAAGGFVTRLNRLADNLANGAGAIERLGKMVSDKVRPTQNPGELLSYVKSSDRTVRDFYNHGIVDAQTREVAGPSFKSLFDRFNQDDDAVRKALDYVVAKRDVGRGLSGVGNDAQRLADAQALVRWGDNDPVMREFATDWKGYTDGIGKYAVDSGLWTQELWNKISSSDALYVRYKRLLESPARDGMARNLGAGGSAYANVTGGVQRFTGSSAMISNPAEAMAEYTAAIIRRADRYRVGAAMFDAVDALGPEGQTLMTRVGASPTPAARISKASINLQTAQRMGIHPDVADAIDETFAPITDPKNPTIWRNSATGGREYAVIHSDDLWKALSGLQVEKDPGAFRAFADVTLRPLRRIFTAATTGLSPRFALATNPIRDIVDAQLKTESGLGVRDIAEGYYHGILDLFGKSDLAEEAARNGLGGVSMFGGDLNPSVVSRRFAPVSTLDKVRSVSNQALSKPVQVAEKLGEASDKSPRMGEYIAALRQAAPKVASGEWTEADARLMAAGRARRVTIDFANKPGNKYLRELDDYIPFFGVALKAPVTIAQSAAANPVRAAAVSAGMGLAAFTAWSLKNALPHDAQQKINDRPATERSGFLLVPLDNTGENLLRVPLPQELGLVAQGVTAALDKVFENDPHAGRLFGQAVARALPPGIGEALIDREFTVPIPGIQQLIENARNKRSFGGAPVESPRLADLPPEQRRYDTTSPTFDAVAAAGRKLGATNFSPLQAENLVRGVASQATPLITNVTDPIAARVMGRDLKQSISLPLSRDPLNPMSAIKASPIPPTTESEQDYYSIATRARQARALLNQAAESGDMSAVPTLRAHRDVLSDDVQNVIEAVDAATKELRDQTTAVRQSVQAGNLSPDRGRQQIDQLKGKQQAVHRRAVDILRTMNVNP